jgi:hypothetical protein
MPSKSYFDFLTLLKDVEQLQITHSDYTKGKKGRKNLGYLTRSAMVMLCASWERYNENLLLETIDLILATNIEAKSLPKEIKLYLSDRVKENKNNIYPIELADNGWRNLWKGYAINETNLLNTPNSEKLNKLFKRFLGIDQYTKLWIEKHIIQIDDFIKIRGEIAHNGSKAKYVRFSALLNLIYIVTANAIEIDYNISQLLKNQYGVLSTWNETYYRKLATYKGL